MLILPFWVFSLFQSGDRLYSVITTKSEDLCCFDQISGKQAYIWPVVTSESLFSFEFEQMVIFIFVPYLFTSKSDFFRRFLRSKTQISVYGYIISYYSWLERGRGEGRARRRSLPPTGES